jgi:hypothetical protein
VEASDDKRTYPLKLAPVHADNIIATLRDQFVVFDRSPRAPMAKDLAGAQACLARSLLRRITSGPARSVVFSITPSIG